MGSITDIPGIRVGHATHPMENTGCTVILPEKPAVAGVDIRGSAPGTRETDLLRPTFLVQHVHAIMLTGGSAFGLRTADGAMQFLLEHNIGFAANGVVVPVVPAAVIFDLTPERNPAFPSTDMGYEACYNAGRKVREGAIGAGRGATVGKMLGPDRTMSGGVGSAAVRLPNGLMVGALAVVNALGDVIDPADGSIVAGARDADGTGFADSMTVLREHRGTPPLAGQNTTLAVVATTGRFSREGVTKIAQMAQNGLARVIRPAHTMYDGDTVFALSVGDDEADINLVGELAAETVAEAIVRAVRISNAPPSPRR